MERFCACGQHHSACPKGHCSPSPGHRLRQAPKRPHPTPNAHCKYRAISSNSLKLEARMRWIVIPEPVVLLGDTLDAIWGSAKAADKVVGKVRFQSSSNPISLLLPALCSAGTSRPGDRAYPVNPPGPQTAYAGSPSTSPPAPKRRVRFLAEGFTPVYGCFRRGRLLRPGITPGCVFAQNRQSGPFTGLRVRRQEPRERG